MWYVIGFWKTCRHQLCAGSDCEGCLYVRCSWAEQEVCHSERWGSTQSWGQHQCNAADEHSRTLDALLQTCHWGAALDLRSIWVDTWRDWDKIRSSPGLPNVFWLGILCFHSIAIVMWFWLSLKCVSLLVISTADNLFGSVSKQVRACIHNNEKRIKYVSSIFYIADMWVLSCEVKLAKLSQ